MATTITPTIITLNAYMTAAPQPSTLQQSGALVSVGGTTLTTGTYQYCGTLSAVEALLSSAGNYAELTSMATTFFAQGNAVGVYVLELGVQSSPNTGIAALNTWITDNPGIFYAYLVPADWDTIPAPSAPTVTVTALSTSTLPAGTYYTQIAYGNASGAIGDVSPATTSVVSTSDTDELVVTSPPTFTGATVYFVYMGDALGSLYLQNGSSGTAIGTNYSQSVPLSTTTPEVLTLDTMAANYASANGKTYFFGTTTSTNIGGYSASKSLSLFADSPSMPDTEFSAAGEFYQWLVNSPGAANILTPMGYRSLTGVTPWPSTGYTSQVNTILTAYGNIAYVASEAGFTGPYLYKGTLMDGSQASWWYGVDWILINVKQALAAAVVNGSNQQPPLLYDQKGINALQAVAQKVCDDAVTFGCALSAVVTAQPFYAYSQANPGNYKAGIYDGFSIAIVGQNGFLSITVTVDAIQFV